MIRASFLCMTAVFLAVGAEPATAAFPGKPGPIAYSKVYSDEVAEGRVESTGGLFMHGPRVEDRPRQLTRDLDDTSPSYSADGQVIVFASRNDATGSSSIYVISRRGRGGIEVTDDGLGGTSPYFFPHRLAIVFVRRVDGHSQIFTIRINGSDLRQLTSGPHDNYDPVVSPNGKRIAFTSDRDPDDSSDRSDIFTMRADGSDVRAVIDGPRSESEPDYAPDGRRLVFVIGSIRSNVFVARLGGDRMKRLTPCEGIRCRSYHHPVFSPDGRHIALLSTGSRTSRIEVLRSDGDGSSRTFDSAGVEEEGFGSRLGVPTWAPQPTFCCVAKLRS